MPRPTPQLPQLRPGQAFPPVEQAWGPDSPACGLLAAGARLDVPTLVRAYSSGIFPWFSEGQPILWWSTDPRMVLDVSQFHLRRSLKQALQRFRRDAGCEIRIDSAFEQVIASCAQTQRGSALGGEPGDSPGTWIVPDMINAYCALHRAGYAHSVETWVNGELVGGLYCVALGKAVFGESMFSVQTDASKIALAALVCFCRRHGIQMVDCQQNTGHLASLGAQEMARSAFLAHVKISAAQPAPEWRFDDLYWHKILTSDTSKL
jgi:leucyl/phenylalanyl-tRNA---protein transferase